MLTAKELYPKKFIQKDKYTFTIEWSNGKISDFRLSELQQKCPCASCRDLETGKRRDNIQAADPNVTAKKILGVGRYALKIEFSSGCTHGIYTFNYLYEL